MKKYIALCLLGIAVCFLGGCQKDYYGFGKPFAMSTSRFSGYYNRDIATASADNYERFMHASYIQLVDKFGNQQKIKISANIARHDWDFENLDNSGMFKNYVDADGFTGKVGIDVSEHQGVIDWETVSQYVDFAIIRVGYRGYTGGNIARDKYFARNIEEATEYGIPVGVYFYSQAVTYEEGAQEADFVLEQTADYDLAYPVILDREDPMQEDARTNDLTPEQHTQAALGFLETIDKAGKQTMTYSNRTYLALYFQLDDIYRYPVWYAQYADEPDWPYEFTIWQYTEGGTVPGVSGFVDMNLQMMELR